IHPYRILSIGSMADLDAATIEDVRAFHSTYYVPNNATIILSGDVDPQQALAWVEKYFGPIPKGGEIPRNIPQEPAQTAERRVVEYDANTPLPVVMLTYHVPEEGHLDTYALQVASRILSDGQSSRLYRKLVYEQQIALQAGGEALTVEDPGVFYFYAILQQGHGIDEAEKSLLEDIEKLQQQPVSAEELDKARNQIIAGQVFNRQTVNDKAVDIGHADVILGDWRLVNQQIERYQKVSADDVQAVARKYFRPENRTIVHMLPETMRPSEGKP
ncbi:MAG TPA: pitrilysin family protein, partial [Gemmatimonadales bacterium]|nr:pitrilysin family protein [Gemmatimonadales bacterium]